MHHFQAQFNILDLMGLDFFLSLQQQLMHNTINICCKSNSSTCLWPLKGQGLCSIYCCIFSALHSAWTRVADRSHRKRKNCREKQRLMENVSMQVNIKRLIESILCKTIIVISCRFQNIRRIKNTRIVSRQPLVQKIEGVMEFKCFKVLVLLEKW